MKNKTCKTCGERFHYCSSCSSYDTWEDEYCKLECWRKSIERKSLVRDAARVVRGLGENAKAALVRILGGNERALGVLTDVIGMPETPTIYDPEFGDDKLCRCGHTYERHFDPFDCDYEGCKYCPCGTFAQETKVIETVQQVRHSDHMCSQCRNTGMVAKSFDGYSTEWGPCECTRSGAV